MRASHLASVDGFAPRLALLSMQAKKFCRLRAENSSWKGGEFKMKYQKPELQMIGAATKAVESLDMKHLSTVADSINQSPDNSGPAYEADE